MRIAAALPLALLLVGCSDDPQSAPARSDAGATADTGGSSDTADTPSDTGTAPSDTGTPGDAGAGDVPANAAALFPWLQAKSYATFPAESKAHASTGPHGAVRTFLNPTLDAAFAAGSKDHPVGSAAVKELYESDGTTLKGWAVMVKTKPGSTGDAWYWYEVFSTTSGASPVADGNGVTLCTGCHAGGTDYVVTPYPLK